jgi:hypothetical protein
MALTRWPPELEEQHGTDTLATCIRGTTWHRWPPELEEQHGTDTLAT